MAQAEGVQMAEGTNSLKQEIEKVSDRLDKIDERLTKFEVAAKVGSILAVIFGIASGIGGYVLKMEHDAVRKVQEDTIAVTNLTANVASLQKAIKVISSDVGRASLPVLEARIKNVTSTTTPAHYGYSDYLTDMQSLANLTLEYLALVPDKNNPISEADSRVLFSDLKSAADAARSRAQVGLKALNDQYFDDHIKAPDNFKNLVDYLVKHEDIPLSDDEVTCYQAAFPNWYYHITHSPSDSPNSPHCQSLIHVGPA